MRGEGTGGGGGGKVSRADSTLHIKPERSRGVTNLPCHDAATHFSSFLHIFLFSFPFSSLSRVNSRFFCSALLCFAFLGFALRFVSLLPYRLSCRHTRKTLHYAAPYSTAHHSIAQHSIVHNRERAAVCGEARRRRCEQTRKKLDGKERKRNETKQKSDGD